MSDHLTPGRRSWNMQQIRSKNTGPERLLRSALHRMGYRFRTHEPSLPGKPDIILPKYKTLIHVYGCFWHRHRRCRFATTPSTNRAYWLPKFAETEERDRRTRRKIRSLGWQQLTVWECELQNLGRVLERIERVVGTQRARTAH